MKFRIKLIKKLNFFWSKWLNSSIKYVECFEIEGKETNLFEKQSIQRIQQCTCESCACISFSHQFNSIRLNGQFRLTSQSTVALHTAHSNGKMCIRNLGISLAIQFGCQRDGTQVPVKHFLLAYMNMWSVDCVEWKRWTLDVRQRWDLLCIEHRRVELNAFSSQINRYFPSIKWDILRIQSISPGFHFPYLYNLRSWCRRGHYFELTSIRMHLWPSLSQPSMKATMDSHNSLISLSNSLLGLASQSNCVLDLLGAHNCVKNGRDVICHAPVVYFPFVCFPTYFFRCQQHRRRWRHRAQISFGVAAAFTIIASASELIEYGLYSSDWNIIISTQICLHTKCITLRRYFPLPFTAGLSPTTKPVCSFIAIVRRARARTHILIIFMNYMCLCVRSFCSVDFSVLPQLVRSSLPDTLPIQRYIFISKQLYRLHNNNNNGCKRIEPAAHGRMVVYEHSFTSGINAIHQIWEYK